MSKTNPVEDLATNILAAIRADDRDLAWLSEKSGIAYSTLRSKLIYKPERITAGDLFKLAKAMKLTVPELLALKAPTGELVSL